jgi:hypothetical protein
MLSSQLLFGESSAQNSITVTGTLTTQADTDVSGLEFRLSSVEGKNNPEIIVGSDGEIETTVLNPGTFRVTIFDYSTEFNKLPAVYSFPNIVIDGDGDIGEFTLPEAYKVDIRCLDTDGNPVSGLPISFRAPNGTGTSPGTFTTTADGYVKYKNAAQHGVELADGVEIELQRPDNPDVYESIQTVNISEPDKIGGTSGA